MNRKIRTWVEISLNDLEHNYREISSRLPDGCQMLGVCKANAYGHGAVRVSAKSFHDEVMQTQQEIERILAQNNQKNQ